MPSDIVRRAAEFRRKLDFIALDRQRMIADLFAPLIPQLRMMFEQAARDLSSPQLIAPKTYRGAQVRKDRAAALTNDLLSAMEPWANSVTKMMKSAHNSDIALGSTHALDELDAITKRYGLGGDYYRLNEQAAIQAAGMINHPHSPLNRLFSTIATGPQIKAIQDALLTGTTLGQNPRVTARRMAEASTVGVKRATLIARTEQIRAVRLGSLTTYKESGIVTKYKRLARKDSRTCFGCLALDGEVYDVESMFEEHPNGRCSIVPIVKGAPEPEWETGAKWLADQDEATQRLIMGNGHYEDWLLSGRPFADYYEVVENPVWGDNLRKIPVTELRSRR